MKILLSDTISKAKSLNIDVPIVTSSDTVIEYLKNSTISAEERNKLMCIAFDVSSLYTSLRHQTIMDTFKGIFEST